MWRLVLTVSLLCWGCEGTVSCRNENNGTVDWYILYKAPKIKDLKLTGLEYLYIDSNGVTRNNKPINDPNGVLANTLQDLFIPIRRMPPNFGFISYSDQPPGCTALEKFGHSKGVLVMDKSSPNSTGVWLLHSTPRFPFRRDQNHFWPESGKHFAQTFICVTFPYSQFRNIGKHLQYIGAFSFEHDLPDSFHQELKDAVKWKFSDPPQDFQPLPSSSNKYFYSVAKQQSNLTKVGDLYVTIAEKIKSDVYTQTWGRQPGRAPSYCEPNKHRVYNIKTITSVFGDWQPNCDHSKWCVVQDYNWTCIADVNRATTQYRRRGGALCLHDYVRTEIFKGFVMSFENCTDSDPNITDVADCDTETLMD